MLNRRTFLKTGLTTSAGIPLAIGLGTHDASANSRLATSELDQTSGPAQLIELPARLAAPDAIHEPWQQKVRRIGQSNMTEHDPAVMNIEEWADYWHRADADLVYISVTGILAFYPSKVPFHKHGKYLNGRDFFGECVAAAKKRGMRVVARMSPDLNWGDALEAHPEWAMRYKDGSVQHSGEDPRLFKTCMFSSYMDDYIPAIIEEVNSLYDVDCFYANGWPPLGSLPECHCGVCSKLPPSGTPAYWGAFNDRVFELWQKYDGIAKQKKSDSFFFANSGGNVRSGPNLDRIGKVAVWFQADNQGRTYDEPSVWGCSLQGRVCNAVLDGKVAANVTAAYSTGVIGWRNASKNPDEARMWLNETSASGMRPYFHFIGSEDGFGEDRRWQAVGEEYFRWTAKHDEHFKTRKSIANIGVVIGQSTQLLYPGPTTARSRAYMHETTEGVYDALLQGRFAFDFVHEDRLDAEGLRKYRLLVLPNVAMLSDRQCGQIREFVRGGGSIFASFETSLYDENLNRRTEFGLADVLGISKGGDVVGTNGNAYYARIEMPDAKQPHPVLDGFRDTNWIPGSQNRIQLKAVSNPVLTVVPGFVRYPPELAYPPVSHTNEPAMVLQQSGRSRTAYFSGDIERSYWLTGHGDLLRLLSNTFRWLTDDERVVQVSGEGMIEMFCWETAPGYAVHLLNYTNPNAHHGWMGSVYPLGPQTIRMKLPAGSRVKSVDLLRAERSVSFAMDEKLLHFVVPRVGDYEVAAITLA